MKKSAVYVALLLVVAVCAAVICIRVLTNDKPPEQPEPAKTVQTLPPAVRVEGDGIDSAPEEIAAAATEPPVSTPEPPQETEKPFETREPVITEAPAEETPPLLEARGSFRSDTGTNLNLVAEWYAAGDGEKANLQVTLSAESYSFQTTALYHSLQLTVNGVTYSADSPDINYTGENLARTPLAAFSVEIPGGTTVMEAVWHYKGSYSGQELADITAAATVELG